MKRAFILFLLCAFLCACSPAQSPPTGPAVAVGDGDTFMLSHLPDIGEYSETPAPARWYDDYTDSFIPSEEYGPLIPYRGAGTLLLPRYGLCTADGVIVTDPVYTEITDIDGEYYLLKKPEDLTLTVRWGTSYSAPLYEGTLIPCDGAWATVLCEYSTRIEYVGSGVFYVKDKTDGVDKYLDIHGNVWAQGPTKYNYMALSDGRLVRYTVSGEEYTPVDTALQPIGRTYEEITAAHGGYYIVKQTRYGENGERTGADYGVTDKNDGYAAPAEYAYITYGHGLYLFYSYDGTLRLTDADFNTLCTLTCAPADGGYTPILEILSDKTFSVKDKNTKNWYNIAGEKVYADEIVIAPDPACDKTEEYVITEVDGAFTVTDPEGKVLFTCESYYAAEYAGTVIHYFEKDGYCHTALADGQVIVSVRANED